jgi:hypothetical protein
MVYLQTKNYDLGIFWMAFEWKKCILVYFTANWSILCSFGIFYCDLVYLWSFGIFCGHLVYCMAIWYVFGHLVNFMTSWYVFGHLVYFMVIWNKLFRFGTLQQERSGSPAHAEDLPL